MGVGGGGVSVRACVRVAHLNSNVYWAYCKSCIIRRNFSLGDFGKKKFSPNLRYHLKYIQKPQVLFGLQDPPNL